MIKVHDVLNQFMVKSKLEIQYNISATFITSESNLIMILFKNEDQQVITKSKAGTAQMLELLEILVRTFSVDSHLKFHFRNKTFDIFVKCFVDQSPEKLVLLQKLVKYPSSIYVNFQLLTSNKILQVVSNFVLQQELVFEQQKQEQDNNKQEEKSENQNSQHTEPQKTDQMQSNIKVNERTKRQKLKAKLDPTLTEDEQIKQMQLKTQLLMEERKIQNAKLMAEMEEERKQRGEQKEPQTGKKLKYMARFSNPTTEFERQSNIKAEINNKLLKEQKEREKQEQLQNEQEMQNKEQKEAQNENKQKVDQIIPEQPQNEQQQDQISQKEEQKNPEHENANQKQTENQEQQIYIQQDQIEQDQIQENEKETVSIVSSAVSISSEPENQNDTQINFLKSIFVKTEYFKFDQAQPLKTYFDFGVTMPNTIFTLVQDVHKQKPDRKLITTFLNEQGVNTEIFKTVEGEYTAYNGMVLKQKNQPQFKTLNWDQQRTNTTTILSLFITKTNTIQSSQLELIGVQNAKALKLLHFLFEFNAENTASILTVSKVLENALNFSAEQTAELLDSNNLKNIRVKNEENVSLLSSFKLIKGTGEINLSNELKQILEINDEWHFSKE
ncbi:Hypothetical_protein [Hexamita inflata]|uniref:Hypothetical_protein n=1 Tax=Hexamita inflata TaxID=28002 RepID=A0AA86RI48_9EUKA|nr:Hypothetical protein HINF_LOCUS61553 [Hexamita inflata]